MIAAIEKAESLGRHRAYLGCPYSDFAVCLTQTEALELLEHYVEHADGWNDVFWDDLHKARAAKDPWIVLNHFHLLGFAVVRLQ